MPPRYGNSPQSRALRVAFVVQRCGDDVVGGAESLCLQLAEHLRGTLDVEILTTCATDYMTWRNAYPPGPATVRGVNVRRFATDRPRNVRSFDALSRKIAAEPERASFERQERWMRAQGPISSELFAYVIDNEAQFDAFVFFGYLYATTFVALPSVAHKAVLMPFAHDEWMIRLPMWDAIFSAARALSFATEEERAFVKRRFPKLPDLEAIVAASMVPPADRVPERFRKQFGIDEPYVLYLGRVDRSKGVDALFDYFRRYRASIPGPLKLAVAGSMHTRVPRDPNIVLVGRIDERTKWDALEGCKLLVMPSHYESLSLAVLEAWACAKPVLANAASDVLVAQCRRSGGGRCYGSYAEFAAELTAMNSETRALLGSHGRDYFVSTYDWDDALRTFVDLVTTVARGV